MHNNYRRADIFRVIANTLNFSLTTDESEDSRINNEEIIRNKVKQKLGQQHTLLIVDNFETIDEEEKHKLLVFLTRELPKSTVAVVTTRQELYIYTDVTLGCLSEKENLQLTQQELVPLLETRNISLNEEQISQINQTLYQHRRGHPLAIILDIRKLVTQLEDGGHLNWNLGNSKLFIKDDRHLEQALQEVLGQFEGAGNFSLKGEIEKLRGTPAHKLLMSLAIFKFPAVKDAIVKVAGIDEVNQAKVDEELKRLRQLFLVNLQHPKESQEKMRYWMLPFTQDYIVTQELTVDLNFRVAAEERWVKWYQDLASKYGGKDWEQWYINYDYIEQEWENLSAVLDWCASQKRISDVSNLWNYLNDYASLYGHWVKRLFWTEWLIKESSHDPEWPTKDTIHAMSSKGFTLIQMGRGDEAEKLLLDAWGLALNKFPYVKDSVAKHLSYLYIRQGKYEEARQWLEHERCAIDELIKERDNLVQQLGIKITQIEESSEIDNTALIIKRNRINRSLINIDYYEGEICFQEKKYDQAELIFRKVVDEATQLKWTRRVNYAKHWLADIRIAQAEMEMQRNNFPGTGDFLSQARELLTKGYLHAELNHDQRRMANFQFSCARLEQLWADLEKKRKTPEEATVIYQEHHKKAIEWANLAIDSCTRLGMEADRKRIYNSFPCLANSQA